MPNKPKIVKSPAPNPSQAFTEVTVKGRTLKLCFTYGALALAEHRFHKAGDTDVMLLDAWPDLVETVNVMFLFACSLGTYHPEIGWDEAVAMIDQETHADIVMAILSARGVSLPDAVANPPVPAA